MRTLPIPFSGAMVRALLAGAKTQTRRVVKPQSPPGTDSVVRPFSDARRQWAADDPHDIEQGRLLLGDVPLCPYGVPGDRLWVREAWRTCSTLDKLSPAEIGDKALDAGYSKPWAPIQYEADGARNGEWRHGFLTPPAMPQPGRYRHARFMPRWASRTLLEVTEVRVERLHDISEVDAIAEGVHPDSHGRADDDGAGFHRICAVPGDSFPIARYAVLWESINGPGSWDANPWVWVVEFKRVT